MAAWWLVFFGWFAGWLAGWHQPVISTSLCVSSSGDNSNTTGDAIAVTVSHRSIHAKPKHTHTHNVVTRQYECLVLVSAPKRYTQNEWTRTKPNVTKRHRVLNYWSTRGKKRKRNLPSKNLANASMTNSQLTRNITGSDALMGKFHNSRSYNIGQWTSVDEYSAELVHTTMT